jgi:hypothetical protein
MCIRDRLQAGWKLYWYYDPYIPQQYVEWCVDGIPGGCADYFMSPIYASHNWGTTVDYWVERVSDTRWCATTDMIQRYCKDNIHPGPVSVYAKSEVHETQANPLDTTFDQVRFKDPSNNWWYLFDSHETWVNNYPYNIDIISTSHFRTYREITNPVYLPIIMK